MKIYLLINNYKLYVNKKETSKMKIYLLVNNYKLRKNKKIMRTY